MIGPARAVRLAPKARLQRDRALGQAFLLYPERGLELSDSAARIVAAPAARRGRSRRSWTSSAASASRRERIESEVLSFLRALDDGACWS